MEENNKEQIENELDYLAELLFECYMERKGYESYDLLCGEKRWRKESPDSVENSDNTL